MTLMFFHPLIYWSEPDRTKSGLTTPLNVTSAAPLLLDCLKKYEFVHHPGACSTCLCLDLAVLWVSWSCRGSPISHHSLFLRIDCYPSFSSASNKWLPARRGWQRFLHSAYGWDVICLPSPAGSAIWQLRGAGAEMTLFCSIIVLTSNGSLWELKGLLSLTHEGAVPLTSSGRWKHTVSRRLTSRRPSLLFSHRQKQVSACSITLDIAESGLYPLQGWSSARSRLVYAGRAQGVTPRELPDPGSNALQSKKLVKMVFLWGVGIHSRVGLFAKCI